MEFNGENFTHARGKFVLARSLARDSPHRIRDV